MKTIVIRRKWMVLGGVLLACFGLGVLGWMLQGNGFLAPTSATPRDLPIYCTQQDSKKISLSFDAAWGNEDTQQLIDILEQYKVKVTFFVVGDWVDKFPESVKALSDAGHEVMNHSNTHPHLTQLSVEEIKKEITSCDEKIEKITGVKPFLTRPPYGDYNDTVVGTLRDIGHYTIQWDVDSLDWKELSAEEITQRVKDKVGSGSIVLFHNAALHTPEALPQILEFLQGEGYEIVPISQLIYRDNFEINHEGRQIRVTQ